MWFFRTPQNHIKWLTCQCRVHTILDSNFHESVFWNFPVKTSLMEHLQAYVQLISLASCISEVLVWCQPFVLFAVWRPWWNRTRCAFPTSFRCLLWEGWSNLCDRLLQSQGTEAVTTLSVFVFSLLNATVCIIYILANYQCFKLNASRLRNYHLYFDKVIVH